MACCGGSLAAVDAMPLAEYMAWMRYDAEEPLINGAMVDVLFASLKYVVAQVQSSKTLEPDSFRIYTERPAKTEAEIIATLRRLGFKEE